MDIEDYDAKVKSLLEYLAYQPTTTDPTTYLEKTTKIKIKNSLIDEKTQLQIHKEGVPLRPIVSSIESPLQLLARYLAKQLQPHAEEVESYVKNASHFIKLLKKETVQTDHLLVSFDVEKKDQEISKIRTALLQNGFSERNINNALEPPKPKTEEEKEKPVAKAYLPYVKGTTDKISRILRRRKIETPFNTDRKISTILPNFKTKINLENQGVYKIPCGNCDRSYVGQTNRRTNMRKEEHQNAVQRNEKTSSLAQHAKATSHTINFENTRSIANIEHKTKRIIREAIEIEKTARQPQYKRRHSTSANSVETSGEPNH
ncbi:hypothetical protein ILUMI_13739 [Ignelater luminosus]|uniref:Uncharacterized protein n=1 Tax=Ignelater luminosus TaxID=2038154 RepID=A0A8K0CRR2_IGNLU|nr:hypothetical protein ILUMI_13739 [Ignelater luminosus]